MKLSVTSIAVSTLLLALLPFTHVLAQTWTVGQSRTHSSITAVSVPAQQAAAPRIVVIGSLSGDAASTGTVQIGYEAYVNTSENFLDVTFIGAANPDAEPLQFPPPEPAYSANPTAWSLWQWLGSHAPDAVILVGGDEYGLGEALANGLPGVGSVPSYPLDYENELIEALSGRKAIEVSPAHQALVARGQRSANDMAQALGDIYGQQLPALTYIPAMALIGKLQLSQLEAVERIVAPTLAATEALQITSSLQIAGHLLFAELAERTGNPRYLALARRAADLAFDANGNMQEAMPFHGDYSDAFFMATPLLAKVGKLSGDTRYFDMALRHVEFLHSKLLRADGLYNHWPRAKAAWGRGNAFVALGLALALSDIPVTHAAHARLLTLYQQHIGTLLNYQDVDGMWHNIIDMPGSWGELSATAMIATAIQRGVDNQWLEGFYQNVVERAWEAVVLRTDDDMGFTDVCESTPGQDSFDAYVNRKALQGRDERAGGMMLLFAAERLRARSLSRQRN